MGSTNSKAVKTMAEEIARALKNYVDTNNKAYVNKQITNAMSNASSSGGGGGGGIMPGTINASQVRGLYNTVAGYIINAASSAAQGDEVAGRIISTLSGIAAVELQSATIDTAQIRNLYASYGHFIDLIAEKAQLQEVDTAALYAELAVIGLSKIDTADIDFAQIKDVQAETMIFRKGEGSDLYIDRLNVTDANIVSLSVGELMIRRSDGKMVKLYVDELGEIKTASVSFDASYIINADSISARELNVAEIFADSALVQAIKAVNIDVGDLFADNGFIGDLHTYVITPAVGNDINISGNSSVTTLDTNITLANGRISMMITDGSTASNITLTNGMVNAVANAVTLKADTIDLSANTSIRTLVGDVSDINTEIEQLDTSITLTARDLASLSDDFDTLTGENGRIAVLEVDVEDISQVVYDPDEGIAMLNTRAGAIESDVSTLDGQMTSVTQTANKINWVVTGDTQAEMELTNKSASLIADEIYANANNIDLSANNTVRITAYSQVSQSAVDDFDLIGNTSLTDVVGETNKSRMWFTFDYENGFEIRRPEYTDENNVHHDESNWSTQVTDNGFYINHKNVYGHVGAFYEDTFVPQSIRMGNLICKPNSNGGWTWSVYTPRT